MICFRISGTSHHIRINHFYFVGLHIDGIHIYPSHRDRSVRNTKMIHEIIALEQTSCTLMARCQSLTPFVNSFELSQLWVLYKEDQSLPSLRLRNRAEKSSDWLSAVSRSMEDGDATYRVFQNFVKNWRVLSHQFLTSELTARKPHSVIIVVHVTISVPVNVITSFSSNSLSQVRFLACQFYLSKFDVTRPSNFHEVLKTSVRIGQCKTVRKITFLATPIVTPRASTRGAFLMQSLEIASEQDMLKICRWDFSYSVVNKNGRRVKCQEFFVP